MSAFDALKLPVVWILAIPYFLMLTAGYGYTFWIPIVIRDTLHTTDGSTALITAMIATVSMTVMLLTAINSDRMQERFFHAASGGLLIAIGFAGAVLLPVPALKIVFLGVVLVGCNTLLSPFWCMPTSLLSGEAAAVGIALINSIGNIGGFVGPYMIGFLKDATGGNTGAFLGLAAFGLGIFVIFAALNYTAFANPSRRARSLRPVNEPDLLPDLS
jgi:ACS family tartrate transporter-like MFS transporter